MANLTPDDDDFDDGDVSPELQAEIEYLLKNPPSEKEQAKLDAMERRAARTKQFGKNAGKPKDMRTVTVSLRVNTTLNEQMKYWSNKRELTLTEYITDAVREKIARENGDYDLPTMEQARLAQLIDNVKTLDSTVGNFEKSFMSMIESIVILSRDPKYMIDSARRVDDE